MRMQTPKEPPQFSGSFGCPNIEIRWMVLFVSEKRFWHQTDIAGNSLCPQILMGPGDFAIKRLGFRVPFFRFGSLRDVGDIKKYALRVFPAETRLTVYRRLRVLQKKTSWRFLPHEMLSLRNHDGRLTPYYFFPLRYIILMRIPHDS